MTKTKSRSFVFTAFVLVLSVTVLPIALQASDRAPATEKTGLPSNLELGQDFVNATANMTVEPQLVSRVSYYDCVRGCDARYDSCVASCPGGGPGFNGICPAACMAVYVGCGLTCELFY